MTYIVVQRCLMCDFEQCEELDYMPDVSYFTHEHMLGGGLIYSLCALDQQMSAQTMSKRRTKIIERLIYALDHYRIETPL